jgi:hypothetical protein
VLTWAVKPPACGDVKHSTGYGEQDPPAILAVKFCEGARGVRGEEQRGCMRAGHPRVARFELCGGRARDGGRGEDDALEKVEDVEQQGGVDRVREGEGEGHDGQFVGLVSQDLNNWPGIDLTLTQGDDLRYAGAEA